MADLFRQTRARLQANRTRTYGPVTVPAVGYRRLRVSIDLSDADQLNPASRVSLTIEGSLDGGTTWRSLGQVETWGENVPERQAKLGDPEVGLPWLQVPCPPAGALLRATLATGSRAVDLGVIVEAWT